MATIYKYRNVSSRTYAYLPEGTLVLPGKEAWSYQHFADTPVLHYVTSGDDGKKTKQQALNEAVATYLDANPVTPTQAQVDAGVAAYMAAHP